jgi:hypothetical protein
MAPQNAENAKTAQRRHLMQSCMRRKLAAPSTAERHLTEHKRNLEGHNDCNEYHEGNGRERRHLVHAQTGDAMTPNNKGGGWRAPRNTCPK